MKAKLRKPVTYPIQEEGLFLVHPPEVAPYGLKSEMLTPSEIEQLRREAKEDDDFFQMAFAHLKK